MIANIFYKNRAYGPQTFFENGKQFDFMGVFYNRDTSRRGNQALFIGNWYNSVIENGRRQVYRANIQTTLYKVVPESFPEGSDRSKCIIGEKAPLQMRGD